MELIFQQMHKSTASRRGQSYWEVAANCGERRFLTDLHKELATEDEQFVEEKQRGTYLHALMDAWFKGNITTGQVIDVSNTQPLTWHAAVKLFNFVREYFPLNFWGKVAASELSLPIDTAHIEKVTAYFGHPDITGTVDLLTELSESDLAIFKQELGLDLPRPGLYIIDWKTGSARKSDTAARGAYLESIQSKVYPLLWNLIGGRPVEGMIFIHLTAHANMRRFDEGPKALSSVQAFFAPHSQVRDMQARAAVNFARKSLIERSRNPFACVSYTGAMCPFFAKGICDGLEPTG